MILSDWLKLYYSTFRKVVTNFIFMNNIRIIWSGDDKRACMSYLTSSYKNLQKKIGCAG